MSYELALTIDHPLVTPSALNYRPDMWPPPSDWPIVIDESGLVVSRWGDVIWRLDPWAGKSLTLNFGDGALKKNVAPIDKANADLLRVVMGWWMYGPTGARGARTLKGRFDMMRQLFVACSREGILASNLMRFPKVIDCLFNVIPKSRSGEFLVLLHELFERRDILGFTLLDRRGISRLAASVPEHETSQTPYIPPRIWHYQVTRLRECLDDFLAHKSQIQNCFLFCMKAHQQGGVRPLKNRPRRPFGPPAYCTSGKRTGYKFFGRFSDTLVNFGIEDLLCKWVVMKRGDANIRHLTSYLSLISHAGLAYLLNFSLMRAEEAWNLKYDCLHVEQDPDFGSIYLLRGCTTKTLADPNALWVTSPSARFAVEAMQIVALLQLGSHPGGQTSTQSASAYLNDYKYYPWHVNNRRRATGLRPGIPSYWDVITKWHKKLFDFDKLKVTQQDYDLARLVTPTLSNDYAVGKPWPLAWHQLRRTGAVNMQASGIVSDASLQYQLKHITRAMSLYYGRNHSRVRLEEKASALYVRAMYEALGRQLQLITSERFISPHGDKRKSEIVRLISTSDYKKNSDLAERGHAAFRPVLLGVCTSRSPCPYGGIDNIAFCGGGNPVIGPRPCADVLYDCDKQSEIGDLDALLDELISTAEFNSPLRASLDAQKRSLEGYRNVLLHRKTE